MNVSKDFFIADNYQMWDFANKIYGAPLRWLDNMLKNMTGFGYPSGYAIINPYNFIIKYIWAGDREEYPLYQEIEYINSCIYIDNFEGPERNIIGWKGLDQTVIEKTFNIQFDQNAIIELRGFPNNLQIRS